jgi:hypothetical protein
MTLHILLKNTLAPRKLSNAFYPLSQRWFKTILKLLKITFILLHHLLFINYPLIG